MSLLDNEDQDDVAYEVAGSAFRDITSSRIDTHTAIVVLAIAGAAEIGGLVMMFAGRREVRHALADADFNAWVYSAIGVFLVGFFCAFGSYFFINKQWPRPEARMMSWLISISAGLANVLLFYCLAGGLDDLL